MTACVGFVRGIEPWIRTVGFWDFLFDWTLDHHLDRTTSRNIFKKIEPTLQTYRAWKRDEPSPGDALQVIEFDNLPIVEQRQLLAAMRATLADIEGASEDHEIWQEWPIENRGNLLNATNELVDKMSQSLALSEASAESDKPEDAES